MRASPAGQSQRAGQVQEAGVAAPGAKWGDLTSAVYSASGDLIHISTGGVLAFASVLHYPVRLINKYWANDPSVGVYDGDGFIHNDARYGNIHNTDQSMILPVFHRAVQVRDQYRHAQYVQGQPALPGGQFSWGHLRRTSPTVRRPSPYRRLMARRFGRARQTPVGS